MGTEKTDTRDHDFRRFSQFCVILFYSFFSDLRAKRVEAVSEAANLDGSLGVWELMWTATVCTAVALCLSFSLGSTVHDRCGRPLHVLLVCNADFGHFNPVLGLAFELVSRGHRATIAVPDQALSWADNHDLPEGIRLVGLGTSRISKVTVGRDKSLTPDKLIAHLSEFVEGTAFVIGPLQQLIAFEKPDVAVVDYMCFGGYMAALKADVPIVHLVPVLPSHVVAARARDYGGVHSIFLHFPVEGSLLARFTTDFAHRMFNTLGMRFIANSMKPYMDELDLSLTENEIGSRVTIVPSSFALEPPVPLVPSIEVTGPLFAPYVKGMSEELTQWMDEQKEGFIFASLGTVLQLPSEELVSVAESLERLPHKVLWALRAQQAQELFDAGWRPREGRIRLEKFVPQRLILKHENVRLFVSHCGLNGLLEALYEGVPLVCMPAFSDQPANAQKMAYRGAGLVVKLIDPNLPSLLREGVQRVLEDESFRANATRISKILRQEAKSQRASQIIEITACGGDRHRFSSHQGSSLMTVITTLPSDLDVFLVYVFVLVLALALLRWSILFVSFLGRYVAGQRQTTGKKKTA